jgi:Carbohydrate family 9 binding domain-like
VSAVAVLFALLLAAEPEYHVQRASLEPDRLLASDAAAASAWGKAQTIAWGKAPYETRFRALWAQRGLLLRFDADDPSPWHTMTNRDDHLWEEEVVEIFLDLNRSGQDYAELEISPANVVCDVRMIAPSPNKQMDLSWNIEGLETRAWTNKDAAGKVTGWSATALLPWAGLRSLPSAAHVALPPRPGDNWRFNVFRIERPGGPTAPDTGAIEAAWSKPPGESFHVPEVFRKLVFER